MVILGVFLVKERSYYPRTRKHVKALFHFKTTTKFFNIFFQRHILNRLDETTQILFVDSESHASILSAWANSTSSEDTLFDNMLPYPNTKNYAWDCGPLCDSVVRIRNEHTHLNRSGRPYFGPKIKLEMKACLENVDHYTIEMLESTLHKHMNTNKLRFTHQFSMPKGLRASQIANTDYSKEMLSGNIIGAIQKFTVVSVVSSQPTPPPARPNRPSTPHPRLGSNDVDVLSGSSSDTDGDTEFVIRSSHPTFINDDGTEVLTAPYPTRRAKRKREPEDSPLSFPVVDNVYSTPIARTPMPSMPLSRETSFNFCFSPLL